MPLCANAYTCYVHVPPSFLSPPSPPLSLFCRFSHDRGQCFVKEQLDSTNAFLARGLVIDPSAASLYAFVMGVEGTGVSDEWRMITINFKSLLGRKCRPSPSLLSLSPSFIHLSPPPPFHPPTSGAPEDYELRQEHSNAKACLLGYKRFYNFTKPSKLSVLDASSPFSLSLTSHPLSPLAAASMMPPTTTQLMFGAVTAPTLTLSGEGESIPPLSLMLSVASPQDTQTLTVLSPSGLSDYGFSRTSDRACSKDLKFNLSAVCPPGARTYSQSKSG